MKTHLPIRVVVPLVLAAADGRAQQPPARVPTSPPAINWPSPPLPDGPIDLDTGIQHRIRLIVTKGLNQPWSMAFLPDGSILVTERPGRLRIVRNGVLDPNPAAGLPQIQARGLAGLMDLALHPRFTENKLIYFTYHKPASTPAPNNAGVITLARGQWDGNALTGVRDIFSAIPSGNASRIIFGRDGMLYMTVGVGDPPEASRAQDPNDLLLLSEILGNLRGPHQRPDCSCRGIGFAVTPPLRERREEIFDRLVFGPEVAVQDSYIGDRTLALLSD